MSEFNKFKISEKDLPEKARKVISKICRDGKWQMSIPPNEEDSDMVLVRIIEGFTKLKEENEKLKCRLHEIEKVSLTIFKGLEKGISTVPTSFPHGNLKHYFMRYKEALGE